MKISHGDDDIADWWSNRIRRITSLGVFYAGDAPTGKRFGAQRQLEVDENEQLEVVEEQEKDWDSQDELMDVERQASSMQQWAEEPPKSVDDDGSSDTDDELDEDEDATSDGIVLFISFVIYIVIGSIAIAAYEPNMDFFEVKRGGRSKTRWSEACQRNFQSFQAIYFNFVTLTTIGLGDLVPQSDTYLVITLVYCTVGLALTTIAIEIAADTLKKLHYFGRKMENVANVQVWISMKALVKNLGDQFNVPIDELETLNLEQFVDNAMKVEQGELATLRVDKGWMKSNYWQAIESGTMHYVDDDDLVTLQSNRNYYSEF
ncbi:unnamed protein product [Heligmosomoides polygyrus]|uniref:Ion_trans_2 domain-containing protein n=1 Tax=Heligmosomoides polygyrus TaxID=6339 RepID=A0A3P7WL38_HELPZ|nr:unnamed protein product [Heligmosomoides polygyrus]